MNKERTHLTTRSLSLLKTHVLCTAPKKRETTINVFLASSCILKEDLFLLIHYGTLSDYHRWYTLNYWRYCP